MAEGECTRDSGGSSHATEIAHHHASDGGENPGQLQVREQPIDAVRTLAHFLDKQNGAFEVGQELCSEQARKHL